MKRAIRPQKKIKNVFATMCALAIFNHMTKPTGYLEALKPTADRLGIRLIDSEEAERDHSSPFDQFNEVYNSFAVIEGGERLVFVHPDNPEHDSDSGRYMAGMHEFGHHVMGHTALDKYDLSYEQIVDYEGEAWTWALENANRPLTDDDYIQAINSHSTYTDELARRQFDDPVTQLLRTLGRM